LEGWFYGDENGYKYLVSGDRSGDFLFNETAADGRVHLWARWIDACLEESYVYEADQHAQDLQGIGKINLNEEVVMTAARQCSMGTAAKLDVNRKLQGGMYNTIVLPFAIPEKTYFDKVTDLEGNYIFNEAKGGSAPSILVYEGYERITENGEEVLQLIYHELGDRPNMEDSEGRKYESIPAYTPFLIKPTGGNVTTRLHFWPAYVGSGVPVPNYTGDITPMGHFIPGTVTIPDGSIMLILVSDNRLAKVTSSGEMLGLRGYFLMPESMKSMPAQICIKENASTDTEEVEADSVDGAYKILDNQRVYIIRGKEVYTIMGDHVR
jgi:hypothetical protein